MEVNNKVFIATSLDGYIADKDGGIAWLDTFPEINTIDSGYNTFVNGIDALVMGRATYEKVLSFGIDWPYTKPVFVLSTSLKNIPENLSGKVQLLEGELSEVINNIHALGYSRLYVDGGGVIQQFLKEDRIDEMIITVIPVLLGKGIPLFGETANPLIFECVETNLYLNKIVQNRFVRQRQK